MRGGIIYHCGPVMVKEGDQWVCKAAGPTTSSREEPYQWEVIRNYGIRGVIGKGGMGEKTLNACREYGAITGKRIFFEWTLIAGKNDSPETAARASSISRPQNSQTAIPYLTNGRPVYRLP